MASSQTRRVAPYLYAIGVAVAALGLAFGGRSLGLWSAAPVEDDAPATAAESAHSDSVTLARAELTTAAGIEVVAAQAQSVDDVLKCNGSVDFNQNKYVEVPPRAEGIINRIQVDLGAAVKPGDVLALVASQSTGDLKASYIKALIHEQHLRWQVDRYQEAVEGVPAKTLLETQHLLEEQQADTARLYDRLLNFGFSADDVKRIVTTKDTSATLPVFAPRGGVVVVRDAVEGEPVEPGQKLFAVADLDTMWVNLKVDEQQLRYVRLGQSARFLPDGLPGESFAGKVTWISPQIDPQTRTVMVRAEVANRDGMLKANMFGQGELSIKAAHEHVVVPDAAVQWHDGRHVVFVAQAGERFEARAVEVGEKHDHLWEITSGLKAGENVATTGSFLLKSNLENPQFGTVE